MNERRVKTAVLGVGRWGRNVARELAARSELVAYSSQGSLESEQAMRDIAPYAVKRSLEDIAGDPEILAVAIATPIDTHFSIAHMMLTAGKQVFVEKPLTVRSDEANSLVTLAKEKQLILMTGYIFLFHSAYQVLKEIASRFTVTSIEMVWKKYGTFEEPLALNLLTHHLALALDLVGVPETFSVERSSGTVTPIDQLELRLIYPQVQILSSIDRASAETYHRITLNTTDGIRLIWDGSRIYTRDSNDLEETLYESTGTPLGNEMDAYMQAIHDGTSPRSDGVFGTWVLELYERVVTGLR